MFSAHSCGVEQLKASDASGQVRAIDGGKPIPLAKHDSGNSRLAHSLLRRQPPALVKHLALTDERECHLRHRRKIAARAHRTFLTDDGRHAFVQHRNLSLHNLVADARMPPAMGVKAQKEKKE